jgi:hypothetical protein
VKFVKSTHSWRPRAVRGSVAAGAAVITLVAGGLAGCTSTLGYAAVVNGSVISQKTVNQELADVAANTKYVTAVAQQGPPGPVTGTSSGTYNKPFVAYILDQEIRIEIIRQRLAASQALPSPTEVTAAKTEVTNADTSGFLAGFPARYQNLQFIRQADVDAFVATVTADLTPDAVNQYYQAHQSDYSTEACVRHILIADKDSSGQLDYAASLADAKKIKSLLDAGGDFAALAKQYSQDNQGTTGGTAAQGGVVAGTAADGCNTTSDLQLLAPEFAQAVVTLPVNQVSAPVKTQFGYHLIEVTKRVVAPLDSTLTADIHQRVAGDRLNQLVAAARVKVNPEFGSFDSKTNTNGQIPGVLPPLVPNVSGTTVASTAAGGASSTGGSGSASGG